MKQTPERVAQIVKLRGDGMTVQAIAKELGVSWHTVRNAIDPEAYARHKRRAMEWSKANPEKAKAAAARYHRRPDVRERRNAALRERYANEPEYRAQRDAWTLARNRDLQPRLAQAVRSMTWAIFAGERVPNAKLANAGIGKPLAKFVDEAGTGNSTDHIVPLSRFDLSDPVQLLQAIHWSNVRRIALRDNLSRDDAIPEGVTIDSLPYVADAIPEATAFIARFTP